MSDQPSRNILLLALVGLILVSVVSISFSGLRGLNTQMDTVKTIQVSGTGSVSAAPDEAIIYLAVQTQDTSATTAVNENAALMAKVMQALTTLGINQSDIQTSSYTLTIQSLTSTTYPMQNIQPSSKSNATTVQYVATNAIQITLTNTSLVGRALDAATNAGVNEVNGITFTFTPQLTASLQKQAIQLATQDAANQAEAIASTLGLKIIGPTSITPSYNQPFYQTSAAPSANPTPIEPGTLQLTAQVQTTYEFTS
ncbi:MAG: SIMPL domain-containing protein [Candidatus Bathyarchaeia archaeon]